MLDCCLASAKVVQHEHGLRPSLDYNTPPTILPSYRIEVRACGSTTALCYTGTLLSDTEVGICRTHLHMLQRLSQRRHAPPQRVHVLLCQHLNNRTNGHFTQAFDPTNTPDTELPSLGGVS